MRVISKILSLGSTQKRQSGFGVVDRDSFARDVDLTNVKKRERVTKKSAPERTGALKVITKDGYQILPGQDETKPLKKPLSEIRVNVRSGSRLDSYQEIRLDPDLRVYDPANDYRETVEQPTQEVQEPPQLKVFVIEEDSPPILKAVKGEAGEIIVPSESSGYVDIPQPNNVIYYAKPKEPLTIEKLVNGKFNGEVFEEGGFKSQTYCILDGRFIISVNNENETYTTRRLKLYIPLEYVQSRFKSPVDYNENGLRKTG